MQVFIIYFTIEQNVFAGKYFSEFSKSVGILNKFHIQI